MSNTKTKFRFQIIKYGSMTDNIIRAICSHNEGKVPLCLNDFISYAQFYAAIFPSLYSGQFCIEGMDEENELRVTEDGGKTFTMIIEEITLYELETVEDTPPELFTQTKTE